MSIALTILMSLLHQSTRVQRLKSANLAQNASYIVCLDPGHPSEVGSGAATKKLTEMELVWDVALKTQAMLKASTNPKFTVVMTKHSLKEFVTNRKRAEIGNEANADLILRIHADSGGRSGIATYYPDHQVSLQGHFGPPKLVLDRSAEMAPLFHQAMVSSLAKALPDLGCFSERKTSVGGKQGALTGSVFSEVPVFLVELCAVDNKHDAAFASTDEGKSKFANALVAGVKACLGEGTLRRSG